MKVKTNIRSGRLAANRNGVKVKSAVRSGRLAANHSATRR